MSLSDREREHLLESALEAQKRAFAPYSRFYVGAAILHLDGRVFDGANVENASYGLTICAERVAASYAVTRQAFPLDSQGNVRPKTQEWRAVAVASRGGVTPCGACRQFLMEFAPGMEVLLIDSGTRKVQQFSTLRELLPGCFEFHAE